MKKRALSLALAGVMAVTTLAGCGSSSKETTAAPEGTTTETTTKAEAPADTTNWLPVGEGDFHLFLRIYKPDATALTDWQPPVVRTN